MLVSDKTRIFHINWENNELMGKLRTHEKVALQLSTLFMWRTGIFSLLESFVYKFYDNEGLWADLRMRRTDQDFDAH